MNLRRISGSKLKVQCNSATVQYSVIVLVLASAHSEDASVQMMTTAKLGIIKKLWGIEEPISESLFRSIEEDGYTGVELIRLSWTDDQLLGSLNRSDLALVCQVHTTGGFLRGDDYVYCDSYNVEDHREDFSKQLIVCFKLIGQVKAGGFINVHAGVDAWTTEQAMDFLVYALDEVSKVNTIKVTFETNYLVVPFRRVNS